MMTRMHDAYVQDARDAYALYQTMRTDELLVLKAAHEADLVTATTAQRPEGIVFGVGRLALIALVLMKRGVQPSITCPVCLRVSFHPRDIAEKYCGFCHQFHDDVVRGTSRTSQT